MIFTFPVSIPANTPASAPVVQTLQLTAGTIDRVLIDIPAGHVGLTALWITDGLHQVFPSNQGAVFIGSNETIDWNDAYELANPPYALTAYAYNTDDTYQHTFQVHIAISPAAAPTPSITSQVKSLLGLGGS